MLDLNVADAKAGLLVRIGRRALGEYVVRTGTLLHLLPGVPNRIHVCHIVGGSIKSILPHLQSA